MSERNLFTADDINKFTWNHRYLETGTQYSCTRIGNVYFYTDSRTMYIIWFGHRNYQCYTECYSEFCCHFSNLFRYDSDSDVGDHVTEWNHRNLVPGGYKQYDRRNLYLYTSAQSMRDESSSYCSHYAKVDAKFCGNRTNLFGYHSNTNIGYDFTKWNFRDMVARSDQQYSRRKLYVYAKRFAVCQSTNFNRYGQFQDYTHVCGNRPSLPEFNTGGFTHKL